MKRESISKGFVILVAVGWLFVVVINYYIAHKPFTGENALAMLNHLANLVIAGLLYLLAATIGQRVTRTLEFASPLQALVLRTGLGLGLISFAVFALGLLGLLQRVLFWSALLLALFLLRHDVRAIWRALGAVRFPIASRFERALAMFSAATVLLAFVTTLPPTLAWDAQLYHLFGGKFAFAHGRIGVPPDVLSLSYPAFMAMLYLAAMVLKDDGASALIHFGFTLLTCGALASLCLRFFSARVGWIAIALLLSVPSFVLVSTWPYTDAALAFFTLSALSAILVATEQRGIGWYLIAGAFAGLALGTKYTAAIVPVAMGIVYLVRQKNWAWSHLVALVGMTILFAFPWYARNWIFMGNPIYPFLFGGRYWDAFRNQLYAGSASGFSGEPWRLALAPWEATILGQEGKAMYEATITPLLLAVLPLLLIVWRKETRAITQRALQHIFVFVGILFAFWLLGLYYSDGLKQTRLLFPAFPAFCLIAALTLERLSALDVPQFSLARVTRWIVLFVLVLTLLGQLLGVIQLNPLPHLLGFESRQAYLAQRLTPAGYWDAMQFLGTLPTPRVYFLWEPRAYYVPDQVVTQPDEVLDLFPHLRYQYRDAARIARALRAQGYEYVLVNRWGLSFMLEGGYTGLTREDVQVLHELTTQHARQIYGGLGVEFRIGETGKLVIPNADREAYAIYRLREP
ncbi:MAG: glycosyltransferase family 39 protein [Chloroflexi bacterium]|nr:glycosyltransferase family 39 protein [Chloroflexota bacterium]